MQLLYSLLMIFLPDFCNYNPRYDVIREQREEKRIFVETGTAGGEGVYMALNADFEEIYSIEFSQELYSLAQRRLQHKPNVHLYLGDSGDTLQMLLPIIQEPALFWLDAHYNGSGLGRIEEKCPLIRELNAIGAHPIKTHTIVIDDVRCFGTSDFDFLPLSKVIDCIKHINPNYEIFFQDGYTKNDVLVAKIPTK